MAGGNLELFLRIRADVKQATAELNEVNTGIKRVGETSVTAATGTRTNAAAVTKLNAAGQVATRSLTRLNAAMAAGGPRRSMREGMVSISTTLQRATTWASRLYVLAQSARVVGDITHQVDAWTNLNSQLRLVTGSHTELLHVRGRLIESANNVGASIQATTTLYTRMARALSSSNVSTDNMLTFTDTLNKAIVVSGASAEEASAGLIQLSQAMASGTLRGDEFRSVSEQIPVVLRLVQQATGKTRGELIKMAYAGQLSSDILFQAVLDGTKEIGDAYADMPLTIERATQSMANQWQQFIGETATASGAAGGLASTIQAVGNHLQTLVNTALVAAAVGVAHLTGKWVEASMAARALTAAEQLQATVELENARLAEATALAEMNKARARRLVATSTVEVTATEQAYAAAQLRTAAATEAANAAGVARVGMLGRVGGGLMALVGGPIGLMVLAVAGLAAGIYSVVQAERERQEAFEKGIRVTKELADKVSDLADQYERARRNEGPRPDAVEAIKTRGRAVDELASRERELAKAHADLAIWQAVVDAQAKRLSQTNGLLPVWEEGGKLDNFKQRLADAKQKVHDLQGLVSNLHRNLDRLGPLISWNPSANDIFAGQAADAFQQLSNQARDAQRQIQSNKETQLDYWKALAATRIEKMRLAGATDAQLAAAERENAALLKTIDSVNKSDNADKRKQQLATMTKAAARAQDELRQAFNRSVSAVDASANAQITYETAVAKADAALAKAKTNLEQLVAAHVLSADAAAKQLGMDTALATGLKNMAKATRDATLAELKRQQVAKQAKVQADLVKPVDDALGALKKTTYRLPVQIGGAAGEQLQLNRYRAQVEQEHRAALIENEVYLQSKHAMLATYLKKDDDIRATYAEKRQLAEQAQQQISLMAAQQGFQAMSQGMSVAFGQQSNQYKIALAAQQSFAIASALINMSKAEADALGQGFWVGMGQIAGIVAQFASIISTLRSVHFATGGPVRGPGTGTSDSVPAWLSNGEYVLRAEAVRKLGVPYLEHLNAARFAGGGLVHPLAGAPSPSQLGFASRSISSVQTSAGLLVSPLQVVVYNDGAHSNGSGTPNAEMTEGDGGGRLLNIFLNAAAKEAAPGGQIFRVLDANVVLKKKANHYG